MLEVVGVRLQRLEKILEAEVSEPAYHLASQTFPTRTEGSVKKHWYKVCDSLISRP